MRGRISRKGALKAGIGLTLIGILLSQADPGTLLDTLRTADGGTVLLGMGMFAIATGFEVMKLHVLLHVPGTVSATARLVMIGLFFNNFLPSSVGGDSYRIYHLYKEGDHMGRAVMPVLLDRLIGLAVQVAVAGLCALLLAAELGQRLAELGASIGGNGLPAWLPGALAGVAVMGVVAVLLLWRYGGPLREKGHTLVAQVGEAIRELKVRKLAGGALFSGGYHACRTTGFVLFALSFGAEVGWNEMFIVLTLVAIVSMVPVSIGALGVREGTTAALLVFFGLPLSTAVAVSLLNLGVLWTKALIGGGLLLAPGKAGRADNGNEVE